MPLAARAMRQIVAGLAAAKSRQDIPAAMTFYHRDCVLEASCLRSSHRGSQEIRNALVGFFERFPDYHVDLSGQAASGDTLIAWGEIRLTLSGRPGEQVPNGTRARVPVFILFRFAEGQVIWESFNFDLATLCRQSGVTIDALLPPSPEALA